MTTLTNEEVAEFQRMCEEEDGVKVTIEEAEEGARRVLRVYQLLLTSTPSEIRSQKVVRFLKELWIREQVRYLKRGSGRANRDI